MGYVKRKKQPHLFRPSPVPTGAESVAPAVPETAPGSDAPATDKEVDKSP